MVSALRDHVPLKQGLRLNDVLECAPLTTLRDHVPLKQGLRRYKITVTIAERISLRDHVPLKQGLRRF